MDRTKITPERWQRMQDLFGRAASLPAADRARLLVEECGEDVALREQVLALLLTTGDDGELEERVEQAMSGTTPAPEILPGQRIGRYRIERLIGRGGMGTVYRAERADDQYHQIVALKLMARGLFRGDVTSRFRRERQILARLNHPNIARLLDGGQMPDGTPYLVMEYVDGMRIDEYCKQHDLPIAQRIPLIQQVCAAVQYAHQNLVVHRDLKPSNILVTADGTPKLLDFGIAKLLQPQGADTVAPLTRLRDRVLTPEHASPEQFRGEPIGTASDIYSLGTLSYGLLSGLHPYDIQGRPLREVEKIVCESTPPPPSERLRAAANSSSPRPRQLARELEGDLDNIVLKAMHADPARRYASAAALSQDLQNYLTGRPVQARPDSWAYRTGKFLRRNAIAVGSTTVVVLLIASLVAFYTTRLARERDVAERERQTAASVSDFMIDVFRRANPNETDGATVTVRAALDAAARRIDSTLADQPLLRLALMHKMSEAYNGLGLWVEARVLQEKALAQERRTFGDRSIEVAGTLKTLGDIQHNSGQFAAAARSFDEALAIRAALGRDRDAVAVELLSGSAKNLRAQLQFAAALERHRRAEALARALDPPKPRVLGIVLVDYSVTATASGDARTGERYAREALPLLEGEVNEGYDLYGNALDALAQALRKQFKLEESEQIYRAFVERQIRRLGPDHLLVARAQNNYANLLRAKGDYPAAASRFAEALRIFALQQGEYDVDKGVSWHNLGALHHEAGDLSAALREIDQAIAIKRRGGARSPLLISSLIERAGILRGMGQLAAADAALTDAESIAREKLDRDDPRQRLLELERGRLLLASGRSAEAEQRLQDAVLGLRKQDDPMRLADALLSLSEALEKNVKPTEARAAATEALKLRERLLPASHPALARARARLAALQ
jgi:tetratricopeptide (TPR) repeat protein